MTTAGQGAGEVAPLASLDVTLPRYAWSGFSTWVLADGCRHCGVSRLDQLLASLGYGSRREVTQRIKDGQVTVGGRVVVNPATKVDPSEVRLEEQALDHPGGLLLMMNKPAGLVCSHDEREGPNVYRLLPERWRRRNPAITSIGRLDKETTGLLLLTDQSQLVHRLTSPKHKVPKRYRATLDREVDPNWGALFAAGTLQLDGDPKPCAPAQLVPIGPRAAEVVLTEGRYHQVRRMFAAVGATVMALHRSHFGDLGVADLQPGAWRELPLDFFNAIG